MGIRLGKPDPNARRPRRDERYQTERLTSPLGKVLDVSASGMRLRTEARPPVRKGDVESFVMIVEGRKIRLPGQVAWVRRENLLSKSYQIGIRFTDQRPGVRKLLEQIGQHGFLPSETGDAASRSSSSRTASNNSARAASGNAGGTTSDPCDRPLPSVGMEVEDLYALLGVARDASEEEIRAAFHALARELHPDSGGESADPDRFAAINKAYRVLRDATLRHGYDQMLTASERADERAA